MTGKQNPNTAALDLPQFTLGQVLKVTGLEAGRVQGWISRHVLLLETAEALVNRQKPGLGTSREFTMRDLLRIYLMGHLVVRQGMFPSTAASICNAVLRPGFEHEATHVLVIDCTFDGGYSGMRFPSMERALAYSVREAGRSRPVTIVDAKAIVDLVAQRVEALPSEKCRGRRSSKKSAAVNRAQGQVRSRGRVGAVRT